jgi:hypothetical protein
VTEEEVDEIVIGQVDDHEAWEKEIWVTPVTRGSEDRTGAAG